MTTWLLNKLYGGGQLRKTHPVALSKDLLLTGLMVVAGMLLASQTHSELVDIIVSTLSDAYLGVSVFVAATLAVFYLLDQYLHADLSRWLNRRSLLQVPSAAFLGALPGCGGAIVVVTQFVHGQMSFGALVAVLISTMGDAAFLLLAREPETAMLVYGISMLAGTVFGYLVNGLHGYAFLKDKSATSQRVLTTPARLPVPMVASFWLLLVPGCVAGLLAAMQIDSNQFFGPWAYLQPAKWLGFAGAMTCIALWLSQPLDSWSARFAAKADNKHLGEAVVAETSFVSVWVIVGFLAYEMLVYFTGLDLQAQFAHFASLAPLVAIVIGLIPGCGPQIVVTTLYINVIVPLSAQLANAISNDGDALFPAIALAPKAAMLATAYSAVPAFIVGYGAYYLGW